MFRIVLLEVTRLSPEERAEVGQQVTGAKATFEALDPTAKAKLMESGALDVVRDPALYVVLEDDGRTSERKEIIAPMNSELTPGSRSPSRGASPRSSATDRRICTSQNESSRPIGKPSGAKLRKARSRSAASAGFARARSLTRADRREPPKVVMVAPGTGAAGLSGAVAGRRGSSEDDLPLRLNHAQDLGVGRGLNPAPDEHGPAETEYD